MSETCKPRRRWFQYSLRSLMLAMFLASLAMSWVAVGMRRARQQKKVVEDIRGLGGDIRYDYEFDHSGHLLPRASPPGPAWLRNLVGEDLFVAVVEVHFYTSRVTDADVEDLKGLRDLKTLVLCRSRVTDAGLEHLKGLAQLEALGLGSTKVTDAGLEHLKGLAKLQALDLDHTKVTDEGVERFHRTLPNCQIWRRAPADPP
jgi:hypothetical protein